MKKLFIMLLSFGLMAGVSAQRHGYGGGGFRGGYSYAPRVVISGGFYAPLYPYYGYYSPFGYPYYQGYVNSGRPSKLTLKVEDIKNDYSDRIYSVRQDNSLTGRERRQKIRELKKERDQAINDLTSNYYKNR